MGGMRRTLIAATAIWLAVMLAGARPRSVGDASEYVAMTGRLADLQPPTFSAADMADFTRTWAGTDTGFELQTRQVAQLEGRDQRWDMPHMWLYPLLGVPWVWVARLAGLSDAWGLVALNVALVGALFGLAVRRGAGPWTLTLFASPMIWWLDKPLADLLIACALGAATLVWPHPASIVLLGVVAAQNSALAVVAITFTVGAVLADPSKLRRPAWIAAVCLGVACAAVGPAYYLWRLGRLSPLTLWTTTASWPSLDALIFPLLDVNMGAMLRFPPGFMAVAAALGARRGWRWPGAIPAAVAAALLLVVVSQQPNQNQGGSPDLSRYALWLAPLALPWLLAMDGSPRTVTRALGLALLAASAAWTTVAFRPTRPESYRYPTALASWLWRSHPAWTSPAVESFAERTSHREPGMVPTATAGCEKVLLHAGQWPASCPPAVDAPVACRSAGLFCYANAGGGGTYTFTRAGRQSGHDLVVHDRTWGVADDISAWAARHTAGTTSGEGSAAVARVRGVWAIGWHQAWTRRDGQLVLYMRGAGSGARIAVRHAVPLRIRVLVPAGPVSERRARPGETPTVMGLPLAAHVMVILRNDDGRP